MDSELICDFILSNSNRELSQMELNIYVFIINLLYYKEMGLYILKEEFVYHELINYYLPYIKEKYKYYGATSIDRPKYIINLQNDIITDFILCKIKELDNIPYWELVRIRNEIVNDYKVY